jgi:hypothetical protein
VRELLFLCESAAHRLETAGLEISIGGWIATFANAI